MKVEPLRKIKEDDRGIIYDCGKSAFLTRKAGTVSANHRHEDLEVCYLVRGRIELTIGDETLVVEAPARFSTASNEYHKLVALTDIDIVIDREGEK